MKIQSILLALACAALGLGLGGKSELKADLALFNGYIYTVDGQHSVADSIAVKDKKIVYVGDRAGLDAYLGEETRKIDLEGKMVLPGFIDSHMHPLQSGYNRFHNLFIENPYSVEDTLQEIKDYAARYPDRPTLEGVGYLRSIFISTNGAPPTKQMLDEIDNTRPVMIVEKNGHSAWVNSKALELAGVDENTPNPPNGIFERVPGTPGYGEPTGQVLEEAWNMVVRAFPVPEQNDIIQALMPTQQYLSSRGLTTVHEMFAENTVAREKAMFDAVNRMAEMEALDLRIRGSWFMNPANGDPAEQMQNFKAWSENYQNEKFQTRSVKFLVDGIIEEKTGLLLEPYCENLAEKRSDCTGTDYGTDFWGLTGQDLNRAVRLVNEAGFQLNAHTIGDGAVKKMLDALEQAEVPASMRPSLEHIQLARSEDIERMGRMGVSANVSPQWMVLDDYFSTYYYSFLGFDRAYMGLYPYQSLFDKGVNVTAASDWYVSEPDIPFQIFTALTRLYPKRVYEELYSGEENYKEVYPYDSNLGRIYQASDFDPENQAVNPVGSLGPAKERARTLEQVIESITINGAKANGLEHLTGSLEVGKMADMVIMSENFFPAYERFKNSGLAEDLEPIANSQVLMTFFEGRTVYTSTEGETD